MSKMCIQCHSKLDDNMKFCTQCSANQETANIAAEFMPTLEVTRESSFIGCLLSFRVFVDDNEIGRLKNGEKKRFQLNPGLHEVYIKVNWSWFYSPKESFLLKDFIKVSCKPKVGILGAVIKIPYYSLFKRHKFISLKQS